MAMAQLSEVSYVEPPLQEVPRVRGHLTWVGQWVPSWSGEARGDTCWPPSPTTQHCHQPLTHPAIFCTCRLVEISGLASLLQSMLQRPPGSAPRSSGACWLQAHPVAVSSRHRATCGVGGGLQCHSCHPFLCLFPPVGAGSARPSACPWWWRQLQTSLWPLELSRNSCSVASIRGSPREGQ